LTTSDEANGSLMNRGVWVGELSIQFGELPPSFDYSAKSIKRPISHSTKWRFGESVPTTEMRVFQSVLPFERIYLSSASYRPLLNQC